MTGFHPRVEGNTLLAAHKAGRFVSEEEKNLRATVLIFL